MRERQHLDTALTAYSELDSRLNDATGLIELGEEEHDEEVIKEGEASLAALRTEVQRREVEALLSGEADGNDTFLEVHAGAAAPRARTGPRCWCACICAGPKIRATRLS